MFVALRGQKSNGAAFVGAGRVAWRRRRRGRRAGAAGRHGAMAARRRRAAGAGGRGGDLLRPAERAADRRSASPAPTARPRRPISSPRSSRRRGCERGVVGTIGYRIGNVAQSAERTTPEAPGRSAPASRDGRRRVCGVRDGSVVARAGAAVASTSSASRPRCSPISPAIISISIRGMEEYFAAKRRLFEMLAPAAPMVVNVDDPYGDAARPRVSAGDTIRASIGAPTSRPDRYRCLARRSPLRRPHAARHRSRSASRLVGRPNAYNIVGAIALASALGLPLDVIAVGRRLARERTRDVSRPCRRRAPTSR